MICPKCHGNGYWIEQLRALRQVRQCKTCSSQGEIKETSDAKTNKDLIGLRNRNRSYIVLYSVGIVLPRHLKRSHKCLLSYITARPISK
jgi:hypothetical protein